MITRSPARPSIGEIRVICGPTILTEAVDRRPLDGLVTSMLPSCNPGGTTRIINESVWTFATDPPTVALVPVNPVPVMNTVMLGPAVAGRTLRMHGWPHEASGLPDAHRSRVATVSVLRRGNGARVAMVPADPLGEAVATGVATTAGAVAGARSATVWPMAATVSVASPSPRRPTTARDPMGLM